MNKQEIIDALNAKGVTFDPAQTKAELAALLGSAAGKPGDEAGNTDTTGELPAGEPEKPADDKPAEKEPAEFISFAVPIVQPALPPVVLDPPVVVVDPPVVVIDPPAVVDPHGTDAPQAETLPSPSPFPKLIPDEEWSSAEQAEFEALLQEKISAGLSKEQALEVIERQIDWDLNGAR